jgi:hypothetical protein
VTRDEVAGHVMDFGDRGYVGYVVREHGQKPWRRFTGPGCGQDLIGWLLSLGGGYPVHLHGPGVWWLEDLLWEAGFAPRRAELSHLHGVTVGCLRGSFDASVVYFKGPAGPMAEYRSAPVTESGRRDLIGWLRTVAPASDIVVADPYGGGQQLGAELREQGWPVQIKELTGGWAVFVECCPDRSEAMAVLHPVRQETTVPATAMGGRALLAWLAWLGPVKRVIVYDAGEDSVRLAAMLRGAKFSVRVERATRGRLAAPPGDTVGGVQVQLALDGLGWLEMHLRVKAVCVVLRGSWLSDAWRGTLSALIELLRGAAEARAVWIKEPGCHRFSFRADAKGMLSVRLFYLAEDAFGTATPAGGGELVLDERVRLTGLAAAFSTASCSLLVAVPGLDVRARWPYGPPLDKLQEIEALLNRDQP